MTTALSVQESVDKYVADFKSVNTEFQVNDEVLLHYLKDLFIGMRLGRYDHVCVQFHTTDLHRVSITRLTVERTLTDGSTTATQVVSNESQRLIGSESTHAVLQSSLNDMIEHISPTEFGSLPANNTLDVWRTEREGFCAYRVYLIPTHGDVNNSRGAVFVYRNDLLNEAEPQQNGGW